MFKFKNTKKQGDYGVGVAISYFTQEGYHVSIPLTDSQDYDLVVDIDGKLAKVQVKTTSFKTKLGTFQANLSVKGGNRTNAGSIKRFDNTSVDYLFIITSEGDAYFIPAKDIEISTNITLGMKYHGYRVTELP